LANDDEAHCALPAARRVDRFQPRDNVQKHLVVFDFRQTAHNPDEYRIVMNVKLLTKFCAPRRVLRKYTEIQTQRNHFDLLRLSHPKYFANLNALLLADNNQAVSD